MMPGLLSFLDVAGGRRAGEASDRNALPSGGGPGRSGHDHLPGIRRDARDHLGADRQGGAPKSFDRSSLLGDHAASAEPGEAPARPRQVAGKQPEARRRVPVAPFCR